MWAAHCADFSCWAHGLEGTQASAVAFLGLQSTGAVVVVHGLGCSEACGIFPDRRWSPRRLHWQTDSLPLSHQGSPESMIGEKNVFCLPAFPNGGEFILPTLNSRKWGRLLQNSRAHEESLAQHRFFSRGAAWPECRVSRAMFAWLL